MIIDDNGLNPIKYKSSNIDELIYYIDGQRIWRGYPSPQGICDHCFREENIVGSLQHISII